MDDCPILSFDPCDENPHDHSETVMRLERKKEVLEALLEEKNSELKKLCIAEAELTGVLPLETPLEPTGSPPKFRRRVGTMFEFTEDMLLQCNFKPSQLQVNSKGRVYNSPKRSRPACEWLPQYDTLPGKSAGSPLSPVHNTWAHSPRAHPYSKINRFKLFKKKI